MVLRTIPYGKTISYGEQARQLGDPNKARAVGAANGKNPLSIVVPCHRVIGSGGELTGFAAGLEVKSWLLDHERQPRLSLSATSSAHHRMLSLATTFGDGAEDVTLLTASPAAGARGRASAT